MQVRAYLWVRSFCASVAGANTLTFPLKKLSNKVISALRLLSKSSFTPSKLRFFGLRKP